MSRNPWTRQQDMAVLHLKLKYQHQLTLGHPAIRSLAKAISRTEASIWMRKCNFDSLDPSVPGRGLNHPANLTVSIWAEYERDPKRVMAEARRHYLTLRRQVGT